MGDKNGLGAYFVTICVRDRMQILSEIVRTDLTSADKTIVIAVGEGLAPPEITAREGGRSKPLPYLG